MARPLRIETQGCLLPCDEPGNQWKQVPFPRNILQAGMRFKVQFGPGEGRVYLITLKEIAKVFVDVPDHAGAGQA
ncbi:MAG: hypothetical protein KAI66_14700 [Lentisphaeria bacterium]|nr:hypothetical protein [Lentisphaeria bacterium]